MEQTFDMELSAQLSELVAAQPKACWYNARNAFLQGIAEGLLTEDDRYVEGFVVGFIPFEHGWIERKDGTILDPTLLDRDLTYFPGIYYTAEFVEDALDKYEHLGGGPIAWQIGGWAGWKNDPYRESDIRARYFWGEPVEWLVKVLKGTYTKEELEKVVEGVEHGGTGQGITAVFE